MISKTKESTFDYSMPLRERATRIKCGALNWEGWLTGFTQKLKTENEHVRALIEVRDRIHPPCETVITTYKDMIDIDGFATCCGTTSLVRWPASSARIVTELENRGFWTLGKARTTEFSVGNNFCECLNPNFPEYSPGGSSNGSAAAIAAGLCDISIGTEAAGSTRWPADHCGVVGLKLTYLSDLRAGLIPVAPSLDTVGLIARSADDLAFVWDLKQLSQLVPQANRRDSGSRFRIGIVTNHRKCRCHSQVLAAFEALSLQLPAMGLNVKPVSLNWWDYRADTWTIIGYELYQLHSENPFLRNLKVQSGTANAISSGKSITVSMYNEAMARRKTVWTVAADFFETERLDAIIMPLDANLPARIGIPPSDCTIADVSAVFEHDHLSFTSLASISGLPAISIPIGVTDHSCPLSVQLYGPHHSERRLLEIARLVETQLQYTF